MAVTFVAANTGTTVAYASSISVTKPTNTNGDLIIAIVGGKMSGAPSGWTMLETSGNGTGGSLDQCNVFYKFASSEGTGSYTFTLSSSQLGCAAVLAYRGVDNVNPIDTTNKSIGTASGTNYTPSSITATADQKALAFAVGYRFGTGTVSQWSEGVSPTITSERADFGRTGSGDNTSMVVAEYDNISGSFAPTITRAATSDTGYNGSFGALDGNAPAAQSSLTGSASGGGLAAVAPAADVSIAGDATVSGVVAFAAPTAEASMSGDLVGSSDVHVLAPSATASLAGITVVSGTADADAPQATAALAGSTSTNGGAISAQAPEATAQFDATSTVSGSLDSGAPSAEMGIDATATVSGTVSATAPGATASILGAYLSAHFAASAPEATSSLAGSVTAAGELTAESPHPDSGDTGLALHVKVTVKDEFAAEAPNAGADLAGSASLGGSVDAAAPGADASLDGDVFEHPQAVVDAVAPMVGADLDGELTVAAILAAPSPYATADIDGERPLPDGPLDADAPMPELVGAGIVGLSGSLGVAVIGPLVSMDGLSDVSIDGILNALAPTASSSMRDTPKQRRVRVEAEIREVIITRDGQTAVIAYEDRTVE